MRCFYIFLFLLMGCSYSDVFQGPREYYFMTLPRIASEIYVEAREMIGKGEQEVIAKYGKKPKGGLLREETKMRDSQTHALYSCDSVWSYRIKRRTGRFDSAVFLVDFCFGDDQQVIGVSVD